MPPKIDNTGSGSTQPLTPDQVAANAAQAAEDARLAAVAAAAQAQADADRQANNNANRPPPARDWLENDDLNGECFVAGEVGELEEKLTNRVVFVPFNFPVADIPMQAVAVTSAQAELFIRLNTAAVIESDASIAPADAAKVAFLRFLSVRVGLASPTFDVAAHHVRYNEALQLSADQTDMYDAGATDDVRALLSPDVRRKLQKEFSNIVCCVAYMFRVRGHHYIPDMATKYQDLWKRCQKGSDDPGLKWTLIAHEALHAIMPDVLDAYWVSMSNDGKIAGALVKRLDSAPAGVAAIRAVYSGAQDLRMAIPAIATKFQAHFDELDQLVDKLQANRWAGSINRRFYGVQATAINFNEQRFGAIAAVVKNCLEAFAPGSPLLKSKALMRIADNAPITGGFIAAGIASLSRDANITRTMLELPAAAV